MERTRQRPSTIKTVGVTTATAVVGAVALSVVAKGVWVIVGTLAAPPVAMTVGAISGGALGWNFMRRPTQSSTEGEPSKMDAPEEDAVLSRGSTDDSATAKTATEVDESAELGDESS
ncbi:hypothetical protein KFU94_14720 [Chloroflexi bacterium TSY]|nr:hypothetical protein [Chloroflexi bacterium TSY]